MRVIHRAPNIAFSLSATLQYVLGRPCQSHHLWHDFVRSQCLTRSLSDSHAASRTLEEAREEKQKKKASPFYGI
jgi:hypothetical protein